MIEVEGTLVSEDLFNKEFVCNISKCKGECCVAGDAGAPLTREEVDVLDQEYKNIKPFMRKEGVDVVEEDGVFYLDWDRVPVTTLVNNAECVFVTFDENNVAKCAIEEAYNAGKTSFKKPISCHLYPIRLQKQGKYTRLNYHKWDVCSDACDLGEELGVKTFRFLKEPIIRQFGEAYYQQLELIDTELEKQKK